jgi:hypothetical protein
MTHRLLLSCLARSERKSEDSRPAEPEEDNVVALALDADTSSDKRDAEAAVSAYITTRREVDP